jgi:asparagine synthetase B (glutamine-hydrolysing)
VCGFVGVAGGNASDNLLRDMLSAIPHGGAHQVVIERGPHFCLACSHSELNQQADIAASQHAALVFFGELYNLPHLQQRLPRDDNQNSTPAHLLLRYVRFFGPEGLRDLDGNFAIAIFDHKGCLLTANHLGIGAPFYAEGQGGREVIVSSHINPLFRFPGLVAGLDRVSMMETKLLNAHQLGRTYFEGIRQVQPECCVEISLDAAAVVTICTRPSAPVETERSFEDAAHSCRKLLGSALRKIVSSPDAVVALALSGGYDSTLLAALIKAENFRSVACYTIYDKDDLQDRAFGALMARELNLSHSLLRVSKEDFLDSLPALIWASGCHGPVFTPYMLAKKVHDHHAGLRTLICGGGAEDNVWADQIPISLPVLLIAQLEALRAAGAPELEQSELLTMLERQATAGDNHCFPLNYEQLVESNDIYPFRAGCDAHGLRCGFPYVDPEVVALAKATRLGCGQKPVFRLVLAQLLGSDELLQKLETRSKEPLFFALWDNIIALGYALKQELGTAFCTNNPDLRYSRNVMDLFWSWALRVIYLKYKGSIGGLTFPDLLNEIRKQYQSEMQAHD